MRSELKKELIKYFKSLGIKVYTNTKARGHQGFFLKNRIDISKNTKEERVIPTLLHEFAHYIHSKLEPDMAKTGGSLEVLFCEEKNCHSEALAEESHKFGMFRLSSKYSGLGLNRRKIVSPNNDKSHSLIQQELLKITNFVDEHSQCKRLNSHKEQIKKKIKVLESEIKKDYPKFMRSKKFKEFDKYIKKSKVKYLLRYDRVKLMSPVWGFFSNKEEIFTIDNLEKDFPDMQPAFCAYIRLKSAQRKQARISKRINYLNKYYSKPTELFARFVECLYIDKTQAQVLAPMATQRFYELLQEDYYLELKHVLEMLQKDLQLANY